MKPRNLLQCLALVIVCSWSNRALALTAINSVTTQLYRDLFVSTISVTNGSASVTSANNAFSGNTSSPNLDPGDKIYANTSGTTWTYIGTISAVTGNKALTLTANYGGTTQTGLVWVAIPSAAVSVTISGGTTLTMSLPINDSIPISTLTLGKSANPNAGTGGLIINNSLLRVNIGSIVTVAGANTITLTDGTLAYRAGCDPSPTNNTNSYSTTAGTVLFMAGNSTTSIPSTTYFNLTIEGNRTVGGAITVNGTLSVASGATLPMGASVLTLSSGSTLTNNGTISTTAASNWITDSRSANSGSYTGTISFASSSQTIPAGNYSSLTSGNSTGTNSLAGNISVSGTLTTTSGGTLSLGSNTLTLGANGSIVNAGTITTSVSLTIPANATITNTGTINTSATTPFSDSRSSKTFDGTVEYSNTSGGQTVLGAATYSNLTLSNSSGTNSANGAITVNGTLTTTSGGFFSMGSNTLTLGASSSITNPGTIETSASTAFSDSRGSKTFGTGLVKYNNATGGQTIAQGTYTSLELSNTSGTNTAGGNITTNGQLTLAAGSTLNMSTFALNANTISSTTTSTIKTSSQNNPAIASSTISIPGFIIFEGGTGTTQYIGKVGSTLTFQNLEIAGGNNSVTKYLIGDVTITGSYKRSNSTTLTQTYNSVTYNLTLPSGSHPLDEFNTVNGPSAGSYHDVIFSYSGNSSLTAAITVSGKLVVNSGTTLEVGANGVLTVDGTLPSGDMHEINGVINLNGGDLIITGKKDQAAGERPFMLIKNDIRDISGKSGCIRFTPSNSGTGVNAKRSVIRFVGTGLDLGGSVASRSIRTNDRAYFEIGDGSTSTALNLEDTLTIFNGIRMRSNSTLTTNGKLKLGSSSTNKFGGTSYNGFIDTIDLSGTTPTITGSVTLIQTMAGSRKFRFLGNPFTNNLNLTDFTDNIDITGSITSTNANNFTSTVLNNPSAFTHDNATNTWNALTSGSSISQLLPLQGLRVMVRGSKGQGLDGNSYTANEARIEINGTPHIGNKTINLSGSGFHFVTNPLMAPVDLSKLSRTNVNSSVTIYVPSQTGMKTYDIQTGVWTGSSDKGDVWLPGSSIFFESTSSTSSVLVEDLDRTQPNAKTYTSYFAELDSIKNIGQIFVSASNKLLSREDGVSIDFGSNKLASDLYDVGIDAVDFGTDSVNLSLISPEGKYLAISKTNGLKENENRRYPLSLGLRNSSLNGDYNLRFEQFKTFESGYQVILLDKLLNTTTDLINNPSYNFKVTDATNTKGDNRFEIVVAKTQLGIEDLVSLKMLDFFITEDFLQKSLTINFIGSAKNREISVYDIQGKLIYQNDCKNEKTEISTDGFESGIYIISVLDGNLIKSKKVVLAN